MRNQLIGLGFIAVGVLGIATRQRAQRQAVALAESLPFLEWYADILASRFFLTMQWVGGVGFIVLGCMLLLGVLPVE